VNGAPTDRLRSAVPLIRAALIVFVLVWLFGPYSFRSSVPIWLPFLIALGLELHLGLSERTARQMMRQQLVENTLRAGTTSEYRVPPECRDGDRLDLRPGNPAFP
jgi:hypothetical protein